MRLARELLRISVLVVYAAQILGGQAVHHALCSNSQFCCGASVVSGTSNSCGDENHRHCHSHGGGELREVGIRKPTQVAADDSSDVSCVVCHDCATTHPEASAIDAGGCVNSLPHDSEQCWICQILGQAQDRLFDAPLILDEGEALFQLLLSDGVFDSSVALGFRSRAPPRA